MRIRFNQSIKVLAVLLLIMPLSLFAQSEKKVTLKQNGITLVDAFSAIEKQTDITIAYNASQIDNKKKINVDLSDQPLEAALSNILKGTGFSYKLEGNYVIIVSNEKPQSQQPAAGKITGVVSDKEGATLPGVSVVVRGGTAKAITDMDGKYTINAAQGETLVFAYIGFKDFEQRVGTASAYDIVLQEDIGMLDEVVVVGFGTQKKVNLTGAVSTVKGEDLTNRPIANTASMLQGLVPGLHVAQGTGQPGEESVSFRIRGNGSFNSSSAPLVLINGVEGDMSGLDSNMIESVSVLKDAASAAIYGSRAANGVILVTTKQGAGGQKPKISYHGNFSLQTPTKMFNLVTNSAEYMTLANIAKTNSGQGNKYPEEEIEKYRKYGGTEEYPNFDWLDYMFNTAFMQTHNLSLAGSTDKTTYNMSLNYLDQDGTLRGFEYKRYNVTLDLTSQATSWMRVGAYATMKHGDRLKTRQNQDDALLSTMSQAPTYMPWLPDDGSGITKWTNSAYGYEAHNKNMAGIVGEGVMAPRKDYDVNTQVWAEMKFLKNLTWFSKGAVRYYNERTENWRGRDVPTYMYHTKEASGTLDKGGQGFDVNEKRTFYTNLYTYLKYDFVIPGDAHSLSAQVGYSQETFKDETLAAYRKDYPFDQKTIDAGGTTDWTNSGGKEEWALQSVFGRLNYGFKDRYLFEANARYDGSSKLSPTGRWSIFPSFSAAWRLTEEEFVKNANISWLSNAKIRGSWGQLGNQDIDKKFYPYQAIIKKVNSYPFDKSKESLGYIQTAYNNEYIKWEKTTMTNVGLDMQFFNRLNVTAEWYNNITTDMLRDLEVSAMLGLEGPTINNGKMQNRGIELSISWQDMIREGIFKGLIYHGGFNFDRTRNKVLKFGTGVPDGYHLKREGLPYNQFYMLECIGVFATQEEIDNSPTQFEGTQPGDLKYRDADGDGEITDNDRVPISGFYPGFEYSLNLGASWKGFDIYVLGQGVDDKKFYTTEWGVYPFRQGSAPTRDYLKGMWTEENPYNAKHPRLYWEDLGGSRNNRPNSYFLQNASYFRLKNITLGYTIPKKLTDKMHMSRLRFYFSGENLLTFTSFEGLDPERTANGNAAQYPQNKSYTFGVNVEF